MERIKHIRETQRKDLLEAQTANDETSPIRDKIIQTDKYDKSTEVAPEQIRVRKYIDSFDEQALKDIFLEHFRRSGSDETTMNWISFDNVRIAPKMIMDGSESKSLHGRSSKEGITLYSRALSNDQELTLWTLIHEECHAISTKKVQVEIIKGDYGDEIGQRHLAELGVRKHGKEFLHAHDNYRIAKIYDDIDEGITELITERIFREYKKRTGTANYKEDPTNPEKKISEVDQTAATAKFDAYRRYWQTAKIYISLISAISDVPEAVTENALIRMYIRNGDILSDEMKTEFGDSCSSGVDVDIMYMLTKMNGNNRSLSEQLDNILSHYYEYDEDWNVIPNEKFQKIRQRLHSALQKVKDEWGNAYKIAPGIV